MQSSHDKDQGTVSVIDYVYGEEPNQHRFSRAVDHLFNCRWCDFYPSLDITETAATARSECPYPDGITSTFTVPLLSGKVIVSDDLRGVYDIPDRYTFGKEFASYNSSLGHDQVNQAMAELGCAHGFVGNSCPRLMQTGPTSYVIVSLDYWETEDDDGPIIPEGWTELAHICTDYWAYCMADFEDWTAKGGVLKEGQKDSTHYVVDMPPGTYRFTNHSGERGFDLHADGQIVYAHIELVKEEEKEI